MTRPRFLESSIFLCFFLYAVCLGFFLIMLHVQIGELVVKIVSTRRVTCESRGSEFIFIHTYFFFWERCLT